jgi:hypothetical protein
MARCSFAKKRFAASSGATFWTRAAPVDEALRHSQTLDDARSAIATPPQSIFRMLGCFERVFVRLFVMRCGSRGMLLCLFAIATIVLVSRSVMMIFSRCVVASRGKMSFNREAVRCRVPILSIRHD